jgi:pantetheine-phosphate adenylyltransferase
MFDRLIVLIATNPDKVPLFTVEERLEMISESVARSNVEVACTSGLVVQFARERGATCLVRGVRTATDIEAEIALANLNFELAPDVATIFVPAEPRLSEVSSSRLKELARHGADVSVFCARSVAERLRTRLSPGQGGINV